MYLARIFRGLAHFKLQQHALDSGHSLGVLSRVVELRGVGISMRESEVPTRQVQPVLVKLVHAHGGALFGAVHIKVGRRRHALARVEVKTVAALAQTAVAAFWLVLGDRAIVRTKLASAIHVVVRAAKRIACASFGLVQPRVDTRPKSLIVVRVVRWDGLLVHEPVVVGGVRLV